jgi:3-isopropylmalate/(R)-2-methylmalate dehydratase large subunit
LSQTLFEKLWNLHQVSDLGNGEHLIYIDRIFLHERTGSIALQSLEHDNRSVRTPQRVFCTIDHIVDTTPGRTDETLMPSGKDFIVATRESSHRAKINLFDIGDENQGISHVISPELGIALPGATLVCPDSHTCTLGGLGALAWGIGSTDAEHAMATNTLRVKKPKTMRVTFEGFLKKGVFAKDMILHLIGLHGANGGSGYMIEFAGQAIRNLPIEARMTLCNMAVEFSGFSGIVAPDQQTFDYVLGRDYAPANTEWNQALEHWKTLTSDATASFDREYTINCEDIGPTVTWGTSPQHTAPISGKVPDPNAIGDHNTRESMIRAMDYMGLTAGAKISDIKLDAAFIGSCTNSRLSDLRIAASFLKGKKVAPWISAICVPGSTKVKQAAEAEGLDTLFKQAGFEWRESGCSMCFYAGGETFGTQQRIISSTNRNFEGRQGPKSRTHLASPLTVAASACKGYICDAEDI